MQELYIYGAILLGVMIFLGVFFSLLRKYQIRLHIEPHNSARNPKTRFEVFYCIKAGIKQITPSFFVAQMVFSNKKNVALDTPDNQPSRYFSEDKN